ncbi:phage holin family protein [Shouchella lonarensis]|uniref:Toxin secretion/phage lysis holin n=1 Tax=Shouchella lonarensis TaxID=1464122 RepID=A0A1G6HQP8_9BACI|nr:phage holin family protein [Shouchella lonarensis]SDB96185.1 toxin secretion/phage lysis holin [Shouchella lonarensis]
MEQLLINLGSLEVAKMYLFGNVKFLDLLLVVMALDIITGVVKAIKAGNLWSRKSLIGYANKMLVLVVVVLANVVDTILDMNGAITYATVIFYIVSEGLSILENLAQMNVVVPKKLADKLKVMKDEGGND